MDPTGSTIRGRSSSISVRGRSSAKGGSASGCSSGSASGRSSASGTPSSAIKTFTPSPSTGFLNFSYTSCLSAPLTRQRPSRKVILASDGSPILGGGVHLVNKRYTFYQGRCGYGIVSTKHEIQNAHNVLEYFNNKFREGDEILFVLPNNVIFTQAWCMTSLLTRVEQIKSKRGVNIIIDLLATWEVEGQGPACLRAALALGNSDLRAAKAEMEKFGAKPTPYSI